MFYTLVNRLGFGITDSFAPQVCLSFLSGITCDICISFGYSAGWYGGGFGAIV